MDPAVTRVLVESSVKIALFFFVVLTVIAYMTWVERRVSAWIQDRRGPNRVGPFGLLQPLADGIKFLFKEAIVPPHVYRPVYLLAPMLIFVPALVTFSVVPIGPAVSLFGRKVALQIADVDNGILVILAFASMGVYGIALAGWSSQNKYSLMGGLRSSAQLISYELAMGIAIVGVLMATGSLRLNDIITHQIEHGWNALYQFPGFLIFVVAAFAETNRLPFDLPEAETELVAGYHTEYSGMRFSMFYMAEYANMITGSALATTLYLGGYHVPGLSALGLPEAAAALVQVLAFGVKVGFFLFVFVWVRWTLPRFRYDQLMNLGWKGLLPIALAHVLWVSFLVLVGRG
ncbi:MAG TPA: NADH-quinone oxidoreductase subunit NuoH [Candidatus Polarisedimenticolia bacterium]|jgi:NADH-quinone oxidoreductase subunit H|nr:NADH-quinone oxidoreductase subunit NuoH [Candidatus Polarisedimenticolia bacterium]